jgi:hypothetical protein
MATMATGTMATGRQWQQWQWNRAIGTIGGAGTRDWNHGSGKQGSSENRSSSENQSSSENWSSAKETILVLGRTVEKFSSVRAKVKLDSNVVATGK